ncbi:hypothetical protein HYU14_07145, partial [Candidatus Woesearchaeota archaeon]|nr:hypothetical protein [Candidatus Woesearchaeota archaeon]
MLDYFSALVQGKPGAFRYKLHRGGFLGTLEKRLMAEDPPDEAALASVQRILYPNLNAAKADFLRVAALSAQIVDEDIGVIFGKWRSDILYASEHDIGYGRIPREKILRQKFRPVHWYRSLPLPEQEHTIGEMLVEKEGAGKKKKELRLTAAQAEGILRALPGFKTAVRRYMKNVRENYLPGSELKKAFETVYNLFKEEQPAIHEALSEGMPVVGFFPREVRGRLRHYFTHLGYESQNPSQKDRHPSEGSNLFDDAQRILSMAELEDFVETLFVESRKWGFAEMMALAEEQKGFMAMKYAPLVGEEKELVLSLIDKIGRCYVGRPGETTKAEREMLTKAGWLHSAKYHAFRERAHSLKKEVERGIIPMEYSPKLGENSLWARVIKTLTGFSTVGEDDNQRIQYLLQLREIGLDTSRISGATGHRTTSKKESRFSIGNFADADYLSEEQRKAIENVYGSALEIEGIAQLPSDGIGRISQLIADVSRIEQTYALYDIAPGVHYFIPEIRRLQQPTAKEAPFRMKGRNGVNVADWEELEKAMKRFGDFTPANSIAGLPGKLEALLDRDVYEAASKEDKFFADRNFVERFAEALKPGGENLMVSKELVDRLENAYRIAQGYRTKFEEHGQALKSSGFNPDELSVRVEKAFSQARIGDDGKPVTFNFPPYGDWVMEIGRFKKALRTGSEPLPPDFLNQVAAKLGAYERLREFVPPEVLPKKYQASLKIPEETFFSWKIVSAAPEQYKKNDIKDSMSKFGCKLGEYLNYRWDGVSWRNSGKVAELRRQIDEIDKHNRTQGHYLQIEIVQ